MMLSDHEKEVLTVLSNTIGLLPPSLDSLDMFPGQLLLPPSSSIDASSSTAPSPAKQPHDDNTGLHSQLLENADILDDTEGDNEFDDFIDDHKIPSDEEPPTVHLEDENKGICNAVILLNVFTDNNDKELFPNKDVYLDNQYPLTAGAISHKSLASHNDMEQWRSLLDRAYEWAREHQPAYQRPSHESFDNGLKPLLPALMYRVRVKQYLHKPFVVPKEGDWVRLNSPPLYCGDLVYVYAYNDTSPDPHDKDKLNFTYRGQKYGDGLHYLVTHDFEPTIPTHEELAQFQRCSLVGLTDITCATNEIAALSLQVMDRVVVTSGELISMTGIIMEFSGNDKEATIRIDSTESTMDVVLSPMLLRKVVRVADRVRVVGGAGDGRVGWVVAVDRTELHVWEDKTALPFKVNVNRVIFHHDTQALVQVEAKQDVSWKPFKENQHLPPHRNLVYLGWRVMVSKRGVFKGYEGIIREILEDDEVRVELSATLKHKVFPLSQLSNLNDEKPKPLTYKYNAKTFQANMPLPAQPVLIPQSLVPLTPSTPLPGGSSVDMGPAWNPSLRTPNPHLQFWWKGGEYEGKKGLSKASDMMELGIAWVQILVPPTTIRIPEMYVTPLQPTRPQEVVIIDDDRNISCWHVYLVLRVLADGSSCDVQEKASSDKKTFITLPTNILAVIV
ncbi:hypothetical protein DXG01_006714 [Tephrocybe rancida]|nr:hypothetical protein DXG01_006714 [Tephrocybe rancida]